MYQGTTWYMPEIRQLIRGLFLNTPRSEISQSRLQVPVHWIGLPCHICPFKLGATISRLPPISYFAAQ